MKRRKELGWEKWISTDVFRWKSCVIVYRLFETIVVSKYCFNNSVIKYVKLMKKNYIYFVDCYFVEGGIFPLYTVVKLNKNKGN